MQDIDVGEPPVLLQKRRRFGVFGFLVGIIVIAGLSGLLWMNYDRLIEASSIRNPSAAADVAAEAEPGVSLADFQAFQQQTTQSLQTSSQTIETQQAELKRLADQVTALSARIDQLQTATPASPPPRAAAPTAPRKQPAAAALRPAGSISVGGAPLPGAPPPPAR